MAAIDPSAESEHSEGGSAQPRATLKLIRAPLVDMDEESDEEFDPEEMDAMLASDEDEEESSDEEANGGPSDPTKSKKARKAAAVKQLIKELGEDMDVDQAPKGKGKGKGKLEISEDFDDDDEEDSDEDDEEDFEPEEFVLCTLDPSKVCFDPAQFFCHRLCTYHFFPLQNYQQTLDITIGEDERVWFMCSGTHSIYLTGNYVEPDHTHGDDEDEYDSEDEDEYDLSPDEDELEDGMSEDELDDMENPRVTEVGTDDEEAPKLVKAKEEKKGKNKRPAEDATTLDDLITKSQDAATNGDQKLSKKQAKKLKNNEGKAVATEKAEEAPSSDKKKVQFAKNLEQGPTGSPAPVKAAEKPKATAAAEKPKSNVRVVQGVTVDDKKVGSGPAAKRGDRVGMRYIGKLQKDGKVFDSNKKGKPFSFKLGTGEVIKGWDIGVAGMTVGGERRITVPAHLAYGSKSLPGIPANSTLIFDVKCLEIK